jgi:pimeloyl-ACP methyl ester carboxylesterase
MKEKIYFIPGLMTDERLWKRVIPLLENEYEIVHLPIPKSEDFDEIIDILFDEIKEEKINILGFSLGGYIASYFAITYPNRVKRVFMLAATPGATNEAEIERRKEKFAIIEKEGFGLSYEKALSLVEEKNQNDEDLIQTIIDMFNDLGKSTFISQLTSTFYRKDLFEDLIHQDFPIWIFYSENDRLLNKEALKKLNNTNHNMKMISREGSSHNIPLEAPLAFASNVKNWMNS